MRLSWIAPSVAALALLGCERPGPPPYGFDQEATQRFVFESEENTTVDETPVTVLRYADLEVDAQPGAPGRTELSVRVQRYYMRVEGAPGGTTELALSNEGLVSRSPQGEVRLRPDEPGPGGRSVKTLLRRPVGGMIVSSEGELLGDPWYTQDPTLMNVPLVDWLLLALPLLPDDAAGSWTGHRPAPPLGQYHLGLEIPIRFERLEPHVIRGSGRAQRSSLQLAPGYRGELRIEHRSETRLSASGQLEDARLELSATFEDQEGGEVSSRYRVRLRRGAGDPLINPLAPGSDTPGG